MEQSHWHTRVKHWSSVTPPLRPDSSSVQKQIELVGADASNVLVLGVTPELTKGFNNVVAVDKEQVMIEHLWIGESATKKAILADWLSVDLPENSFAGIVGDGSLNMVQYGEPLNALFERLVHWLQPGGVCAVRVFSRPSTPVTEQDVRNQVGKLNWHAFRCFLNMHIGSTQGTNIPSKNMLKTFDQLFPDRVVLCEQTGWDLQEIINSMDSYKISPNSTSYPTPEEWLEMVPPHLQDVRLEHAGDYQLAENYPILTFRKPL